MQQLGVQTWEPGSLGSNPRSAIPAMQLTAPGSKVAITTVCSTQASVRMK